MIACRPSETLPFGGLQIDIRSAQTGLMVPHGLLAVPEAENLAAGTPQPEDLVARVQAIADELAGRPSVDWEDDLARGGGPSLALGVERRSRPR
jgi:hypothetical protein